MLRRLTNNMISYSLLFFRSSRNSVLFCNIARLPILSQLVFCFKYRVVTAFWFNRCYFASASTSCNTHWHCNRVYCKNNTFKCLACKGRFPVYAPYRSTKQSYPSLLIAVVDFAPSFVFTIFHLACYFRTYGAKNSRLARSVSW